MNTALAHKKLRLLPVVVAAAVALVGCASSAPNTPATSPAATDEAVSASLTVGTGGQLSNADVYLGVAEGLFSDAGLDVTVQTLTAGSDAIPQLLQGGMQFATVDLATAINATQQNVGIVAVAPNTTGNGADTAYAGLIASPASGITSLADLIGKKVQVNQLGGTAQTLVTASLEKEGLDSSKVSFVEIAPPQAIAALQGGNVDAAVLSEPLVSIALGLGMTYVLNPEKTTVPGLPTFVFVATKAYVDENPAVVRAFVASILAANKLANANPDKVRETAKTSTTVDPALLTKAVLPIFGEDKLTAKQVQSFIDLSVTYGGVDKNAVPKAADVITDVVK